ncbi:urease accessory protein UreD [Paenibacillus agricola]|uniref:Urease accessory protein UreD n=1 Tax=Paenibacillus agricola TaxID=2716264 RepID=A0ABX0J4R7_9BACL|nr:urease accessory protein UreD [Paenibacillus agricola]NHN30415.1 urease accessory protein UreD [Paenibacillus agricola]
MNSHMPDMTGCISAGFHERNGQTWLGDKYHTYPLKIAKTFAFDYGQLGVYMMDASPGIMAGDRYVMDWRFGERTNVYITNQSYTKVHPARPENGGDETVRVSEQQQTLELASNSYVEYMPEPVMLYKDAVLHSSMEVRLAAGSTLILSDLVSPGRVLRGELFQYEHYENHLKVTYEEELIYCSKQRIVPAQQKLQVIGGWATYTHIGTFYLFNEQVDAEFVEALKVHLDEQLQLDRENDLGVAAIPLYYGVSRTYKKGLVLSILGHKVYEIQSLQDAAWAFIRKQLFKKSPLLVRK